MTDQPAGLELPCVDCSACTGCTCPTMCAAVRCHPTAECSPARPRMVTRDMRLVYSETLDWAPDVNPHPVIAQLAADAREVLHRLELQVDTDRGDVTLYRQEQFLPRRATYVLTVPVVRP